MLRYTMAAAAVVGAVMFTPAHATPPPASVPPQSAPIGYTVPGRDETLALFATWVDAWDDYFPLETYNTVKLGNTFLTAFGSGQDIRLFTTTPGATWSGTYTLPNIASVPGPIAGAGLPIIAAAAGFAAWRRRRVANAA